jgi:DNA-binding MarR family transcriptional regulator
MIASPQQLAELLGKFLMQLNRASSPELFRMLGELELSFTQMKALHLLLEAGDVHIKDVAERLGMSLPAMSRALDGLVGRGYVERLESPTDRRARLVRLLPAGRAILTEIQASRLATLEALAASLTEEERAGLHASLLPVVERIHRS